MYCPNCGKSNSVEQKFCRSCGLSLEKTVQSLADQRPELELDKKLRERERKVERLINIIAGTAISIVVVGVFWGIIYEIIIVKGEVITGLFFLAFIVGAVLFGLLSIYRESLRKTVSKRRLAEQQQLVADTGRLLSELHVEPIPSITERTTELLMNEEESKE
jgi:zinc-ribbon domain